VERPERTRFRTVRAWRWLTALLAGSLPVGLAAQDPGKRDQSGYTDLRPDGFPIRGDLAFFQPREAGLLDDALVVGVELGGEARAYPLDFMFGPRNEVLNDALGPTRIAVTWCPVAHCAVVYDRALDGRPLELGTVGLENGVSILYDRQTRSWWSQVAGRAVRGPLEGRRLTKRLSTITTWATWRTLHPGTTVWMDPALPGRRRFTRESLELTLAGEGPIANEDMVVALESPKTAQGYLLRRLAASGRVANDTLEGEPVAVALSADSVTVRAFRRRVGDRVLTLRADRDRLRDAETGSEWDLLTGRAGSGSLAGSALEAIVLTQALWYAWRSQRPDTIVWEPGP
jgi:hypothetical protein